VLFLCSGEGRGIVQIQRKCLELLFATHPLAVLFTKTASNYAKIMETPPLFGGFFAVFGKYLHLIKNWGLNA
jgi:hypothetical protein